MASSSYPKTRVNTLGRLASRASYDFATVHGLINDCPMLHVSFVDAAHAFPVVLPMLGCMGSFEEQDAHVASMQDIYIHGYVSGRMARTGKEAGGDKGLAVTVAASFLDGLVLSLTPFHNSCNYRSAIAYGHATLVTDEPERNYAMRLITENLLPQRWDKSRTPPTAAELSSTSILKVRIASASAKIRDGGPSEDRADLKNKELVGRVWTGVVPYWGTWGTPVQAEESGREEVEAYIEEWRLRETSKAKAYAFEAIEKKK